MKGFISIPYSFLWYLFLSLPLFFTGNYTLKDSFILLCGLLCLQVLGAVLLSFAGLSEKLLQITHSGLSLFLSSLLFSVINIVIPGISNSVLLIGLFIFTVLFILFNRSGIRFVFSLEKQSFFCFFISCILFVLVSGQGDLTRAFSEQPVRLINESHSDAHYFTALVVSLRNGGLFSAIYEAGTPINDQSLSYFIPALWADLFNLTSHQSLWGLAMSFYKVLIFLLFYELCFFIFKDRVTRKTIWFTTAAILLPILLAPLHPFYILEGQVENFIFLGISYLLPGGNPPFTFSFILLNLSLLLFIKIDWEKPNISFDKVLFTILISIMIVGKVALYVAYVVFIGAIILRRIIVEKKSYKPYLLLMVASIIFSLALYKLLMSLYPFNALQIGYGYIKEWIGGLLKIDRAGILNEVKIYLLLFLLLSFWMGIRWIGLWALYQSSDSRLRELLSGALCSILAGIILASFLRIEYHDASGRFLFDRTFDVQQFIRAGFYIISIVASIGILNIMLQPSVTNLLKRTVAFATIIWCLIALSALIAKTEVFVPQQEFTWYDENYKALKTGAYQDGLIAVNPFEQFYGIMLCSSDIGTYWSAMGQADGCYNASLKNSYRWSMFQSLLSNPHKEILLNMKNEGVKYIIATPVDIHTFIKLSTLYPQQITRSNGSQWIFELT